MLIDFAIIVASLWGFLSARLIVTYNSTAVSIVSLIASLIVAFAGAAVLCCFLQ